MQLAEELQRGSSCFFCNKHKAAESKCKKKHFGLMAT
jgi:hypothetical protein